MDKKDAPKLIDMTEEEIYALHHVNEDRLEAMKEYTNARFQGLAIAMFLMSVILLAASVYLHGFTDGMSLFMLAGLGVQGALLEDSSIRRSVFDRICHILYMLPFPAMLIVFIMRETAMPYYDDFLMWFVIGGIAIIAVGVLPHFWRNPYRSMHRDIRLANRDIARMEKAKAKAKQREDKEMERERRRLSREAEKEAAKAERDSKKKEFEESRQEVMGKMKAKTAEVSKGMQTGFSVVKGKITSMTSKQDSDENLPVSEEKDDNQVG